jgi:hypothetical protein
MSTAQQRSPEQQDEVTTHRQQSVVVHEPPKD